MFQELGSANTASQRKVEMSEELLQRRKDAAERQRRSRANKKEREAEQKERAAERYFLREQLIGRGVLRYGCPSAGVNGTNNDACPLKSCPHMAGTSLEALRDEYLFCARRWASAANLADVKIGESVESFERRVYEHTTEKVGKKWESPYLSLVSGKFDEDWYATFDFDPNEARSPFLADPLTVEDINELPEVTATTSIDVYKASLTENRKRIAFESRIQQQEQEGAILQEQRSQETKVSLGFDATPLPAVSLKVVDES
jgi:hypothetical protein